MKKYSFLLIVFILSLILIAGCGGGGGTTGVVPNNVTTNPAVPTETPGTLVQVPGNPTNPNNPTVPSNLPTGIFKVDVKFPGAGSGLRAKELTGSDLPYNAHTLRVTITGEAIATSIVGERNDLDPSGAGTYTLTVSNVPVGLNTATIEVLDPSGNLLCQRKHGFYMTPGTTEGPGLILLGVAIQSDGSYVPQNIDIPQGSSIAFQNHDYTNDRTASMNGGAVTVGPIGHATHITQPVTAEVFPAIDHLFGTAGEFNYDGQSGRVLVYGLPTLTSITPDKDSANGETPVSFTLTGTNFGTSQSSVNGEVRFIQVNENEPNTPWGTELNPSSYVSWGNTSIAGTINLPAGKYRIEVSVRGENTTETVLFYKGTGTYEVIVGSPEATPTPSQNIGTSIVSISSDGILSNSSSDILCTSADGRYIAFGSAGSNLIPDDTNGCFDVFLKDTQTGNITRVSTDSYGNQSNNNSGFLTTLSMSADGRYIVFVSEASNLVANDTNDSNDIFMKDMYTGILNRISVDSSGNQGNNSSDHPSISADGRYVVFSSYSSNLVSNDINGEPDIFVKDIQTDSIIKLQPEYDGLPVISSHHPIISADGRYILFQSEFLAIQIGVIERETGITISASTDSYGNPGSGISGFTPLIGGYSSISSTGRYVAFQSDSANLVDNDTNGKWDIFVKDIQTGSIVRVSTDSTGNQGNNNSREPSISADGRYVAFSSNSSNLVDNDNNGSEDVFVKDILTGITTKISVGYSGNDANSHSFYPFISPNGKCVSFSSLASNLILNDTTAGFCDVFIRQFRP